jgi:1-phosphofructokinase family hexose kinase
MSSRSILTAAHDTPLTFGDRTVGWSHPMIVCLAANPSVDKLFVVERLKHGSIHRPLSFVQLAGGKGLNVARAVATLGGEVKAVSLLGGHTGKWIAEELEAEGIPVQAVWIHGETRSCLSVADEATGALTEFYETGHTIDEADWDRFAALVDEVAEGADRLTISGSLPPGAPTGGYASVIATARRQGVSVALDTRDQSLAKSLPATPDIVKVNATEAGDLLGRSVTSLEDARIAATQLRLRSGTGAAVITRGGEGAVMATAEACWSGHASAQGPYPVGSGDAFLAGLVTALDRGEGWERALALALGAGAANAEVQGTGRLLRERAELIASEAEIVRLDQPADV